MKKKITLFLAIAFFIFTGTAFAIDPPKWVADWTVVVRGRNEVSLVWSIPRGAVRTIVYRKNSNEKIFKAVFEGSVAIFIDKNVLAGTYVYKLQAVDKNSNVSNFSTLKPITVKKPPNMVYSPPKWSESFITDGRILLRWEDTCDLPNKGYNLYRKEKGNKDFLLAQTVLDPSYVDRSVKFYDTESKVQYYVCPISTKGTDMECSAVLTLKIVPKGGDSDNSTLKLPAPEQLVIRKTLPVTNLKLPDGQTFLSPTDVKIDRTGRIYIADTGHNIIHVFKNNGDYEKAIGNIISDRGDVESFENLLGIDVDKRGVVFGVDSYKGIIKGISQRGKLVFKVDLFELFKRNMDYNFEKFGLVDVSVDEKAKAILVVDNYNNHIYKLNLVTGKLISVLLTRGQKNGQVHFPTFSYIDKAGDLLLADTMNQRINVYSQSGEPKFTFGRNGNVLGTFIRPKGVAKDSAGNIYVADSFSNCIQVFSPEGKFKYVIGDDKGNQLAMATPNGIYVDRKNRLYIVEKLLNRVQIRQMTDTLIRFEEKTQKKQ